MNLDKAKINICINQKTKKLENWKNYKGTQHPNNILSIFEHFCNIPIDLRLKSKQVRPTPELSSILKCIEALKSGWVCKFGPKVATALESARYISYNKPATSQPMAWRPAQILEDGWQWSLWISPLEGSPSWNMAPLNLHAETWIIRVNFVHGWVGLELVRVGVLTILHCYLVFLLSMAEWPAPRMAL